MNYQEVLNLMQYDIANTKFAETFNEYNLPPICDLAKEYDCTTRTIARALKNLSEKGYIKKGLENNGRGYSVYKDITAIIDTEKENDFIEEKILKDIINNKYVTEKEYRLPSIVEMARVYECNQRTVRKAFDILLEKGVVNLKQGIGYFVNQSGLTELSQLMLESVQNEFDKVISAARSNGLEDSEIVRLFEAALNKDK